MSKRLVVASALIISGGIACAEERTQVTALKAFHRAGQTFLTWNEVDPPVKDEKLSFPKYNAIKKDLENKSPKIRYRIYRSDKPIQSTKGLTPVAETGQLSCWNGLFVGGRDPTEADLVSRYVIAEGKPQLSPATGVYVHNPHGRESEKEKLSGYYAVTVVIDGKEDTAIGDSNSLQSPIEEGQGQGSPVLQSSKEVATFQFVEGPTLRHYVRWEAPPHANRENIPIDFVVAIPKKLAKPAPVGLHLHCWGGTPWDGYGWWYNAEKGTILIASNEVPYDWWTGYHERAGIGPRNRESWKDGVVRPYTQRRLLSLIDWAATQWDIDRTRVFTGGNSMGGSGAPMLAIRNPDRIAWAIGWVGVHNPLKSPTFKESYAQSYGEPEWKIPFEDGTPVWDYFNDAWYLRKYVERETPFITWSNGKNDSAIGWAQAVEFYRAMQETRRPHMFVWGQGGHGQRALMPVSHEQRVMPIDIRTDQSLPAFTNCSLDGNPGNGDPNDGDKSGGANLYLRWDTNCIVDTDTAWEMTISLIDKAPKGECTVAVTPRRLQRFKVNPGEKVKWSNQSQNKEVQSGNITVDRYGLITIDKIVVSKTQNRLRLAK